MAIAPLGAPINYQMQVQQPFQAALGGLQTGLQLANIQAQAEQARAAAEQQRAFQAEAAKLSVNPNPGFADYQRLALVAPKERQEGILKLFEAQTKDAQENSLRLGGQVLAAVNANDLDTAQNILRAQAEGLKNAGNMQQAEAYTRMADLVRANPTLARDTVGYMVASLPGGKGIFDALKVQTETRIREEAAPAELAKTRAEAVKLGVDAAVARMLAPAQLDELKARAAELKARADEAGTKLSTGSEKLLNDAVAKSEVATGSANNFDRFASEVNARIQSGQGGTIGEWFATTAAAQALERLFGYTTRGQLQTEFVRLRNEQVVKNLPPGAASDSDIRLFLQGFPSETASFETMASFARGMAKAQRFVSRAEEAKAEWVSSFNGLGPAKAPTNIGGVDVTPGTTFLQFQRDLASQIGQELQAPAPGAQAAPGQPAAAPGATAPLPRTGRAPGESGRRGVTSPQGAVVVDY